MKTNIKLYLVITGTLLSITTMHTATAQDKLTYTAYISSSKSLWERAVAQTQADEFSKAMARYGLLNNTMADQDEDTFDKYYDQALEAFEGMIDKGEYVAESKAVLSSIYGLAMAHDSWKGVFLGPKSGGLIESAMKEKAESPLVNKLYAGSKLYTPEMFGGNPAVALEHYLSSISLYETSGDTVNNWLYLDALAHLGITYRKLGNTEMAINTFEKALKAEPQFVWVRQHLLPSAKKSLASE